uniref:Uncharacterized protein isoform X2 n=1 Tax=Pogona vitticeps TaxID=103695 RepID=A0ABM5GPS2_9SAUR
MLVLLPAEYANNKTDEGHIANVDGTSYSWLRGYGVYWNPAAGLSLNLEVFCFSSSTGLSRPPLTPLLSPQANEEEESEKEGLKIVWEQDIGKRINEEEWRKIWKMRVLRFMSVSAFLLSKNKKVPELKDAEWKWHLAFLTEVTELLNSFSVELQGKGKLISDMY